MRQIKFRAWDSEDKRMSKEFKLSSTHVSFPRITPDGGLMYGHFPISFIEAKTDRFTVMQFTDSKDGKAEDIYEGDLFIYPVGKILYRDHGLFHGEDPSAERLLEVKWDKGNFIVVDHTQNDWLLLSVANVKEFVRAGNIYENPKFLEQIKNERN